MMSCNYHLKVIINWNLCSLPFTLISEIFIPESRNIPVLK